MKKIILSGLLFLSTSAFGFNFGMDYLKDFCKTEELSHFEQVIEAIKTANVKQVIKLVNAENTNKEELAKYIEVANEHFGLAPEAKLKAKLIGVARLGLGVLAAYKAWDYYNDKCLRYKNPFTDAGIADQLYTRYFQNVTIKGKPNNRLHNIALDIGAIGTIISAWGGITAALDKIKPKADYNAHLLIRLYLNSLVEKVK